MTYFSVVLGGTFDHLHTGHQALLRKAFSIGKQVTIGLTTDQYVHNIKYSHFVWQSRTSRGRQKSKIASYQDRKRTLEAWFNSQGWEGRYTIVPLEDPYGPTISHQPSAISHQTIKNPTSDFDAIVVSAETRKTAEEINQIRKKKRLQELSIVEIPMIPAEDLREISSTRVRNGDIDTKGRLILPDALRPELRKSIGQLIPEKDTARVLKQDMKGILISVGDMTTKKILDLGMRPTLAIIDFQIERKPYLWEKEAFDRLVAKSDVKTLQSGPGYISREAIHAIHDTFQGPTLHGVYSNSANIVILVDGEEDLLVLPVLIEAPIGSFVYYGQPRLDRSQPHEGIIRVVVTEAKKHLARSLLRKFIPR